MHDSALVTVIVPVYKVEQYLDACLESITSQTHRNLEIIVVDDGSPDACPKLCDAWAQRDARIHVIHKENGGLASARNAALPYATGSFLTFVDSDDIIAANFVEQMLANCIRENADVVMCGTKKLQEDGATVIEEERPRTQLIPSNQAVHSFLYREGCLTGAIWGKIFKAHLFDQGRKVSFPNGLNSEDYPVEAAIYHDMNAIYIDSEPLYGYRMRSGSICRPNDYVLPKGRREPAKLRPDVISIADLCCQTLISLGYSDNSALNYCMMQGRYDALYAYTRDGMAHRFTRPLRKELAHYAMPVYRDSHVPLSRKLKILLMSYVPELYVGMQGIGNIPSLIANVRKLVL